MTDKIQPYDNQRTIRRKKARQKIRQRIRDYKLMTANQLFDHLKWPGNIKKFIYDNTWMAKRSNENPVILHCRHGEYCTLRRSVDSIFIEIPTYSINCTKRNFSELMTSALESYTGFRVTVDTSVNRIILKIDIDKNANDVKSFKGEFDSFFTKKCNERKLELANSIRSLELQKEEIERQLEECQTEYDNVELTLMNKIKLALK